MSGLPRAAVDAQLATCRATLQERVQQHARLRELLEETLTQIRHLEGEQMALVTVLAIPDEDAKEAP